MPAIVVFNGTAPGVNQNDVTASFNVPIAGPYLCYATGSGWTSTAGAIIMVQVLINNNFQGNALVYSNEAQSHKALVPFAGVINLSAGQNSAEMVAAPGTNVDINDRFTMVLIAV